MTEAVARAADVPVAEVRRAMMLRGSLGVVAAAALSGGSEALGAFGLEVGRPVRPMLAGSAPTIADALDKVGAQGGSRDRGGAGVEAGWHQDPGAPVRRERPVVHPDPGRHHRPAARGGGGAGPGAGFRRRLRRRADRAARGRQGRCRSRTRRRAPRRRTPGPAVPLSVFLFDVLHLEGADLIDAEDRQRHAALARSVPSELLMPRLVTASAEEAAAFFSGALAHGHEGVVVKSLTAPYAAGRRGAGWIKVKPRHTLDLVVLAVEWGHGRRRGWLSNLHLGARDPSAGGFVMLGKTFKGLTDELLTWQTERLLALEERRDSYTVYVRPELVAEIAFDGVQRSPRYPGGLALRFARVLRYRRGQDGPPTPTRSTPCAHSALNKPRLLLLALAGTAAEGGGDITPAGLAAGSSGQTMAAWTACSARFSDSPSGRPPSPPPRFSRPRDLTRAVAALIRLPATAARELRGASRITAARGLLLVALLTGRLAGPAGHGTHPWHRRHAGHVPAEHGLHLLLALEEVRDQLGDLADGDAGAPGDARPAGAVDDLRVTPFLRRHGPDDGLGPVQVLVADLLDLLPVLARAGQHAEQVPDRPELAHHGQAARRNPRA